jgi:hypothetical protein
MDILSTGLKMIAAWGEILSSVRPRSVLVLLSKAEKSKRSNRAPPISCSQRVISMVSRA